MESGILVKNLEFLIKWDLDKCYLNPIILVKLYCRLSRVLCCNQFSIVSTVQVSRHVYTQSISGLVSDLISLEANRVHKKY